MADGEKLAQRLALAIPALLLAGAYISEYGFGLFPCEMCWWQRWPHFAAVALAIISFVAAPRRLWIALAGFAILASGLIGGYHAGVEYGWWEGITTCAAATGGSGDALADIFAAPIVRCDEVQWSLFGISLAGFNFLVSTAAAIAIFALLRKARAK
ncbi:MAG TPA: disulfide bond formation protein B [Alteraurantiacibacter sp.]|jgi:disulfide bond formation protein DsbB